MNDKTQTPPANKQIGSPCLSCPPKEWDKPIFSHQLRLANINNIVPLDNVPYVIREKEVNNTTDKKGETQRTYTKTQEALSFLVGKLAMSWQRRGGSFGTLKNTDERTIKLKTNIDPPIHTHSYTNGYDYIAVAGAPNEKDNSKGNIYRFINHGIRELTKFPPATEDHAVQRILVVFSDGTTESDRIHINEFTENLSARIKYVTSVSQLVDFLNERQKKQRLIKRLVFYCHGTLTSNGNCLAFHYHSQSDNEGDGAFYQSHVKKIAEEIFDYDAEVISYACRNGISVDGKDLTGLDAGQKKSIAQKMADCWDIKVQAYEMRSDYAGRTYGTGNTGVAKYNPFADDKEVEEARDYGKVIKQYEKECKNYMQGERTSLPIKPKDYDMMVIRHKDVIDREKFDDKGDGPIMSHGAWHDPITGDSPKGLKSELQPYKPQEWE